MRLRPRLKPATLLPLAVILLAGWRVYDAATRPGPFAFDAERDYRVERAVDGDTLLLERGVRVRLLGVNTPETKHPHKPVEPLGPEAAAFTQDFVKGGIVRLQFDRERYDAVHRVLAYVYVGERCLNEELIRAGFSRAETGFPIAESKKRRYRGIEKEAREEQRGLWALKQDASTGESSDR